MKTDMKKNTTKKRKKYIKVSRANTSYVKYYSIYLETPTTRYLQLVRANDFESALRIARKKTKSDANPVMWTCTLTLEIVDNWYLDSIEVK